MPLLSRRALLATSSATLFSFACSPQVLLANAETDRRFVFIVLRGGMDGLEVVMPTGDPAWSSIGGRQSPLGNPVAIDPFFTLHGELARLAPWVEAGELVPVHAIASPYRDRSHFDAQNIIETGGRRAYELKDGWLARLVPAIGGDASSAVALSANLPVALRGETPFGNYPNARLQMPPADFGDQLSRLWADDPQLSGTWKQARRAARVLEGARAGSPAQLAAHFLSHPEGARVAVFEVGGFDTHSNQKYRLGGLLIELQRALLELKAGLGPNWANTVVVAATEFGRTVAVNGANGTDHGTGTVALVAGGALPAWRLGGKVIADWPGLGPAQLLDGRDLKPTRDLRSLILSVAARQFGKDPKALSPLLFPGEDKVAADRAFI